MTQHSLLILCGHNGKVDTKTIIIYNEPQKEVPFQLPFFNKSILLFKVRNSVCKVSGSSLTQSCACFLTMDSQISTTASSSSSISPTSISKDEYDVFLSFSWEDIGKSFADHLYAALVRKGLRPFREAIGKPESKEAIASESLMAIEKSKVFIVIFSENYARSRYNLDQLVKIVEECRPQEFEESSIFFSLTQEVFVPVYYHVRLVDVWEQKGSYGEAFYNHKAKQEKEKIEKWRKALTEASGIVGYVLGQKQ